MGHVVNVTLYLHFTLEIAECLALVDMVEKVCLKWQEKENENQGLGSLLKMHKKGMDDHGPAVKMLEEKLKDALAQASTLKTDTKATNAKKEKLVCTGTGQRPTRPWAACLIHGCCCTERL